MPPADTHKLGQIVSRSAGHDRLVRTLLTIGEMSQVDQDAIRALPGVVRQYDAYEDIVSDGDKPTAITVIVEGFAFRYKALEDGRRQILSFHIAGDAPDLQSLHIDQMDHSLGTLEPTTVLHIRHDAVIGLFETNANVAKVFWRWSLLEAAVFREWVTNIGQRDAYQRMAHVFCELVTRCKAVGIGDGDKYVFPLTQAEIGDTTGLSPVHVNRTLQALRANKLIHLRAGALTVLDWDGLREAAGFNPAYLHLRNAPN